MKKPITIGLLLISSVSLANEKYAPPSYWLSHGYVRVTHGPARGVEKPPFPAHSLRWPVRFQDPEHQIGNSMLEFQDYGDGPYYHGGCDLRVGPEEKVYAPVAGKLEAGHYGYSNNPDGSSVKYWTPWPGEGDADYFEVAVVTDDGYRFEFHHMNADTLPASIVAQLKSGNGRIQPGELLGQTVLWPDGVYHHTHANIYTPSGVHLNPEYYYEALPDHSAPELQGAWAIMKDKRVVPFGAGSFQDVPEFFAVATNDKLDNDSYVHPPVFAEVRFDSGAAFSWDFRERLSAPDGKFPPIWSFFLQELSDPAGKSIATSGGYGDGLSVIRIPVPHDARGAFVLRIADQAGNSSVLRGALPSN